MTESKIKCAHKNTRGMSRKERRKYVQGAKPNMVGLVCLDCNRAFFFRRNPELSKVRRADSPVEKNDVPESVPLSNRAERRRQKHGVRVAILPEQEPAAEANESAKIDATAFPLTTIIIPKETE